MGGLKHQGALSPVRSRCQGPPACMIKTAHMHCLLPSCLGVCATRTDNSRAPLCRVFTLPAIHLARCGPPRQHITQSGGRMHIALHVCSVQIMQHQMEAACALRVLTTFPLKMGGPGSTRCRQWPQSLLQMPKCSKSRKP